MIFRWGKAIGCLRIEIGGPSSIFSEDGIFPIYNICNKIDGCNFSSETVWEGKIWGCDYYYKGEKLGRQFIGEATEVSIFVQNTIYDFIVSSNCLEHVANPIKALESWIDVLVPDGAILLIVPNKKNNFDHRREYTTFEHLIMDYKIKYLKRIMLIMRR